MGGDHGHGHGHHGPPYKVPDASIYKLDSVPELMAVQRALKSQGLKDPWLRNSIWKYDVENRTGAKLFRGTVGRGMLYGFVAALITTGIGYMLPDEHHHAPGGHDSEEHHEPQQQCLPTKH